jgi:hypothetical protein
LDASESASETDLRVSRSVGEKKTNDYLLYRDPSLRTHFCPSVERL